MQKTRLLNTFRKRITGLNDVVWFQQFALAELEAASKRWSGKVGSLYTTDLFGGNEFAKRCNIRIGELSAFRRDVSTSVATAAFSAGYEQLAGYREEVLDLVKHCGTRRWVALPNPSEKPERAFADALRHAGYPAVSEDYVLTQQYLRLRRNHYAHAAEEVSVGFSNFVRAHGATLNTCWRKTAAVDTVDFSSHRIFDYSTEEEMGLLRVMLRLLEDLDAQIVQYLDESAAIGEFTRHFLLRRLAGGKLPRKNSATVVELARPLAAELKRECGWKGAPAALVPVLERQSWTAAGLHA